MRSLGKTLGWKVVVAARRSGAVVLGLPEGVVSVLRETVTEDSGAVKSLKALGPVSRRLVSSLLVASSAALSLVGVMAAGAAMNAMSAMAAGAPVKEVLESNFGLEGDKTTKGNICTVASAMNAKRAKQVRLPTPSLPGRNRLWAGWAPLWAWSVGGEQDEG